MDDLRKLAENYDNLVRQHRSISDGSSKELAETIYSRRDPDEMEMYLTLIKGLREHSSEPYFKDTLRSMNGQFEKSRESCSGQPDPEVLGLSIEEINISPRAYNILESACWKGPGDDDLPKLRDVIKFSRRGLLKLRNCGQNTVREIEEALKEKGLKLRDPLNSTGKTSD
jgi:DNA-directed RNA polymerase alpha subunit